MTTERNPVKEVWDALAYCGRQLATFDSPIEPGTVEVVCPTNIRFGEESEAMLYAMGMPIVEQGFPIMLVVPRGRPINPRGELKINSTNLPLPHSLGISAEPIMPGFLTFVLPAMEKAGRQGLKFTMESRNHSQIAMPIDHSYLRVDYPGKRPDDERPQTLVVFDNKPHEGKKLFPHTEQPICLATAQMPKDWQQAFKDGLLPGPEEVWHRKEGWKFCDKLVAKLQAAARANWLSAELQELITVANIHLVPIKAMGDMKSLLDPLGLAALPEAIVITPPHELANNPELVLDYTSPQSSIALRMRRLIECWNQNAPNLPLFARDQQPGEAIWRHKAQKQSSMRMENDIAMGLAGNDMSGPIRRLVIVPDLSFHHGSDGIYNIDLILFSIPTTAEDMAIDRPVTFLSPAARQKLSPAAKPLATQAEPTPATPKPGVSEWERKVSQLLKEEPIEAYKIIMARIHELLGSSDELQGYLDGRFCCRLDRRTLPQERLEMTMWVNDAETIRSIIAQRPIQRTELENCLSEDPSHIGTRLVFSLAASGQMAAYIETKTNPDNPYKRESIDVRRVMPPEIVVRLFDRLQKQKAGAVTITQPYRPRPAVAKKPDGRRGRR